MEIHQYPLEVTRAPAEKLTDLPQRGFIQVLRADDSATLRIKSAQGYSVLAAPGVVLPADKGIFLQTVTETAAPANTVTKRGFLLLAWYASRDEIIPIATEKIALPMRRLASNGDDNAIAFADVEPDPNFLYYATGITFGYTGAAPAGFGPASLNLTEKTPGGVGTSQQLMGIAYNPGQPASIPRQVWFPYPMFSRPGFGLRLTMPASGAPGSLSTGQIFGGSIHV